MTNVLVAGTNMKNPEEIANTFNSYFASLLSEKLLWVLRIFIYAVLCSVL